MEKNHLRKPIIFLGVGRSGTTIISEIVFRHRDLAWPSNYQEHFPTHIAINRLRSFFDNRLWYLEGKKRQLNRTSFYNKFVFKPAEAWNFWEEMTPDHIDFSRGFLIGEKVNLLKKTHIRQKFNKLVKYQKRSRLAFKITGPGRISFLQSIFPDAIFIEIVRDPFANIRSLLKVPFWEGLGKYKLWWRGPYTDTEKALVRKWKQRPALITTLQYAKVRKTTEIEVRENKVEHYLVYYEDFVQEPKNEVARILEIAGLRKDKRIQDYLLKNKIYQRNNDAKKFFSTEDLQEIERILQGYSLR